MIKLNIDGEDVKVPAVSELSFKDFDRIVAKAGCGDLEGYLSLYCRVPLERFRRSRLKSGDSLRGLHRRVFDLDPVETVKRKKEVLVRRGVPMEMRKVEMNYFYQGSFYDLYQQMHEKGEITAYELSVRALAIALAPEKCPDMEKVEGTYVELAEMKWKDVLPQAFFLHRNTIGGKWRTLIWSIRYMQGLKRATLPMRIYRAYLGRLERRILCQSYASCFARLWKGSWKWTSRRRGGT